MIEATVVIASSDEEAIRAAADRLDLRALPGVVDVDTFMGSWGDPDFESNLMVLVDDSKVSVGDRRIYENAIAERLGRELPGVRVMGGDEYDLTVSVPPANPAAGPPPQS